MIKENGKTVPKNYNFFINIIKGKLPKCKPRWEKASLVGRNSLSGVFRVKILWSILRLFDSLKIFFKHSMVEGGGLFFRRHKYGMRPYNLDFEVVKLPGNDWKWNRNSENLSRTWIQTARVVWLQMKNEKLLSGLKNNE